MELKIFCLALIIQSVASNSCNGKKCVQKCCPDGKYFFLGECELRSENIGFENLGVYNKQLNAIGFFDDYFGLQGDGFPDDAFKKHVYIHYSLMYKNYFLIENGSLALERKSIPQIDYYAPDEFCIEHKLNPNRTFSKDLSIWFKNRTQKIQGNHITLKWGFLISSIFLLLVLIVYSLLPELRNLGGLILMAYVISLLLGFILVFSIQVGAQDFVPLTCLVITCLTYFFLLASFCWLNVMSYDIWWTFRGYAKARPINRRGENMKFLMYCFYGFGTPLAMTIALATLNEVNVKHPLGGIVPEIPNKGCFIEGLAKYMYLYAPMLIMILANWMFFLMTAFNIWRLSRGSEVLRAADSGASGSASAHKNSKQRFIVYLKLSVLMGLNWILEVVSSFYPDFSGWYITDCYNVFIGVVIFLIFVCKKKVLNKLKKRFTNFKHTHKFSFQSKSRSRSSQDETNTQSIPLQSPNLTSSSQKYF